MSSKKVNIIELISLRRNHNQLAVDDEGANPIRSRPPKRRFRGSLGNWKGTLYLGSVTCFIVLCINVSFVSWAATDHSCLGEAVLYTGGCNKVKRMSTGIHLLINVLSTLLLAASNFSMSSQQYLETHMNYPFSRLVQESANGALKKLMPDSCILAYASYYQTSHGSLILITDDLNTTNSDFVQLYVERVMDTLESLPTAPYSWICDNFAEILYGTNWECTSKMSEMQFHPDDWVVDGYKVNYCLAEELPQTCTLEFSFPLVLVVIVANFFKVIVICATAFHLKCAPLLTAGDAVASFLKRPDEATKGKCLLSRESVARPECNNDQLRYRDERKMWLSSLSTRRWVVCLSS
ncbi:hypothetical protein SI65_08091 [Aspergillus cristatus]|uniref:DUF6536 domain-containing protein n=1 Tax=Aspergillus cristatus TaxID=573508 RepID=A0A1E3B6N4_ASPCR|nr:hypothetical protein SI65_08091 [Aspergillus cristatus]